MLLRVRYAMSGTDMAYAPTQAVLLVLRERKVAPPMVLRTRCAIGYATCGTIIGGYTTRGTEMATPLPGLRNRGDEVGCGTVPPVVLRAHYAISGTDPRYATTRLRLGT
eukprot:490424-Rhodomonas_salina.2